MRADSGFYTHSVVAACRKMDVRYSITIRQHKSLHNLIEAIPEDAWTPVPYWIDGAAAVAETTCTPFQSEPGAAPVRLLVRRVKPTPGSQLALFATYSYHGFITGRDGGGLELEADHRRHAEIENAIRDLKYGVGLNHLPSGRFAVNGAWLAVQTMAHNLARWTARIGPGERIATTKTLRRRFFALAGRLTRSARRLTLHLPKRWPWEEQGQSRPGSIASHSTLGRTSPSAMDPSTGQPNVPATCAFHLGFGLVWQCTGGGCLASTDKSRQVSDRAASLGRGNAIRRRFGQLHLPLVSPLFRRAFARGVAPASRLMSGTRHLRRPFSVK